MAKGYILLWVTKWCIFHNSSGFTLLSFLFRTRRRRRRWIKEVRETMNRSFLSKLLYFCCIFRVFAIVGVGTKVVFISLRVGFTEEPAWCQADKGFKWKRHMRKQFCFTKMKSQLVVTLKTFMKVLMWPELGTQTEAAVAPQYEIGKCLETRRIQAGKRQIQKEKNGIV